MKMVFYGEKAIHQFDPDLDYLTWPAGLPLQVKALTYAERTVLEAMCWDLIHALTPDQEP